MGAEGSCSDAGWGLARPRHDGLGELPHGGFQLPPALRGGLHLHTPKMNRWEEAREGIHGSESVGGLQNGAVWVHTSASTRFSSPRVCARKCRGLLYVGRSMSGLAGLFPGCCGIIILSRGLGSG